MDWWIYKDGCSKIALLTESSKKQMKTLCKDQFYEIGDIAVVCADAPNDKNGELLIAWYDGWVDDLERGFDFYLILKIEKIDRRTEITTQHLCGDSKWVVPTKKEFLDKMKSNDGKHYYY